LPNWREHRAFPAFLQDSREVTTATSVSPITEMIAGGSGLGQQFDVAAVQEIEAAVGEADVRRACAIRRAGRRALTGRTRSYPRARVRRRPGCDGCRRPPRPALAARMADSNGACTASTRGKVICNKKSQYLSIIFDDEAY
jgi:hypothetical protein